MITKIGVIYQDATSRGFLEGLRDRLKCTAELIDPPIDVPGQQLPRRKAKLAWAHFQKKGANLVVHFTDADGQPWRQVHQRQTSEKVVPKEAASMWLCGVAVNNPEEWLYLDNPYLEKTLELSPEDLRDPVHRTDRIKRAIGLAAVRSNEDKSETVAHIVRDAPPEVFRGWLKKDKALRTFYSDCLGAARLADCVTRDERDADDDG